MLLHPKPITLPAQDGTERNYILHKFPAIAGREIVTQYPLTALPKIGDYKTNEALMLRIMSFVQVQPDGADPITLNTRALVENHVPDWELLARIEWAMIEYNTSFFGQGASSASFAALIEKARPWISQMLTGLSGQSSDQDEQRSEN